ncbi:phosphohydrolase [Vallitalea longa]|uniref:Phosphohydrolase n=1 Tax=Vallitalea longa TaxID=2936439 RepID=A0A9W6DFY2_9FIRM|nr:HD domain-containing protein [Vallitalea longa]GKX31726.1 phosphohydrolase [Vallitalea longa]
MKNLNNLFDEFNYHLLNDIKPSNYFDRMLLEEKKIYNNSPLKILIDLRKIQQNPKYHPEGNVYNHTMEVVDRAARIKTLSSDDRIFMWAALLHDVGKITTTKIRKGRITSYDHDRQGENIARNFLLDYTHDTIFINKVVKMVRWHMQPLFICKELPFAEIENMIKETSVTDIACISLCDRLGRGTMSIEETNKQMNFIIKFLNICYERNIDEKEKARIGIVKNYLINEINEIKDASKIQF